MKHNVLSLDFSNFSLLPSSRDKSVILEVLNKYALLLQKWNKVYNLTSAKNLLEIHGHITDSLSVVPFIKGERILDVGSGAGFPGIPLALVFTNYQFTLLDSKIKKNRFLNQVKLDLKMKNVKVIRQRIEAFHPATSFDTIITRATFSLYHFVKKAKHLIKPDGEFLAMKGKYPAAELKQLPKSYRVTLHKLNTTFERHLVVIRL